VVLYLMLTESDVLVREHRRSRYRSLEPRNNSPARSFATLGMTVCDFFRSFQTDLAAEAWHFVLLCGRKVIHARLCLATKIPIVKGFWHWAVEFFRR
jgi:hypothetical protein